MARLPSGEVFVTEMKFFVIHSMNQTVPSRRVLSSQGDLFWSKSIYFCQESSNLYCLFYALTILLH